MRDARISIVVTVYNIAEYLPRFFRSIESQTIKDYKLLIFDDGSTDDTLRVCNEYAEKDERIIVSHLEHVGVSEAKNLAMEFLDTKYTVNVDGDDYVEPQYLEHLLVAIEKYDADLAISRVAYKSEGSDRTDGVFKSYGEKFVKKEDFKEILPQLLDDRRLNYIYGKIYKTEYYKNIRVESDVKQGCDTMINCQYLKNINSLVLIDDLDYNYIKYTTRSVTSYAGEEAYDRILRINREVYKQMEKGGYLSDKMLDVISKRNLQAAVWVSDKILASDLPIKEKSRQVDLILNCKEYLAAYSRLKGKNADVGFEIIEPQSGKSFVKKAEKEKKVNAIKARILKICPKFIKDLRRKNAE